MSQRDEPGCFPVLVGLLAMAGVIFAVYLVMTELAALHQNCTQVPACAAELAKAR